MVEIPVVRLAEAIARADLYVTAEELADVCWLAAHLPSTDDAVPPPTAELPAPPAVPPAPPSPGEERTSPDPPATTGNGSFPGADAALRLPSGRSTIEFRRAAVAMRSPGVLALPRPLSLARALRPIKRLISSPATTVLDEPATADRVARSGKCLPVWEPARERWLDVAVVVDEAPSMVVWGRTIVELLRLLDHSGAFGDVRVWLFDSDRPPGRPVTVRGVDASAVDGRDPRELLDPRCRRVTLVVSDCVGAAWADGRVADVLRLWGSAGPVAIVQPLPQRLWSRCGPRIMPVCLRAAEPGLPNARIEVRFRDPDPDLPLDSAGVPVPVLELDPRWLSIWARLVGDPGGGWHNAMAMFTDLPGHEFGPPAPTTHRAEERVGAFRAHASPGAFTLARYLAAAPLSLPVMRLVQRAVLPASRPAHLAEVFLGDLMQRTSPVDAGLDPDEVRYDFLPGVREILLAGLSRHEALRVISTYVTEHLGMPFDFKAMLTTGRPGRQADERDDPFAELTTQLLRRRGGLFAEKLAQLDEIVRSVTAGGVPVEPSLGQNTPIVHKRTSGDVVTGSGLHMPDEDVQHPVQRLDGRRIVGGLPPRNPHFTGRKELLRDLRELLVNRNRVGVLLPRALYGLGGVGKTQLALEYAHLFQDEYDLVWWVQAEDIAEVRRSLVDLATELRLPESTNIEETIRRVLDALRTGERRWLIVYDNADAPDDLKPYLPEPPPGGHVLVTSRNQGWAAPGRSLEVDKFTRPESKSMLQRRVTVSDEDADRLAERLGDLPLALELAAAWQEETRQDHPVETYLRLVDEQTRTLDVRSLPPSYPLPVAAALGIAITDLGKRSPAATQLLQLCAYLGAEPIKTELLWRGRYASGLPSPLRSTIRDRTKLRRALSDSNRYALITFDTVNDRFQVHRLVPSLIRATLAPEERTAAAGNVQEMLAVASPGNPDEVDFSDRNRHRDLYPHILPSGLIDANDEDARRVVLDQIRYRYVIGDYETSRELARQVLREWEKRPDKDADELTLLARRHLANTTRALGDAATAYETDAEILRLFREGWGPDHEHTLGTVNSVSADLRALGRFQEAYELDRENLLRHQAVLGADDPQTLRTANNLAVDLRLLGDFEGALRIDEDTANRRRRLNGDDHPDTLFAISAQVRDMYGLGRYGAALRLQENALPKHEAALGALHPSVLLAKRSVAQLYRKLGRTSLAREAAQANYLAYQSLFGDDHEFTLIAMISLVNALRDDRDLDRHLAESKRLGQDALARYQARFRDHAFTEVSRANLAIVLRQFGDPDRALALNEAARESLTRVLSEDHPYVLCCEANIASDLAAASRHREACEMSERTLARSRRIRGADHPYTLACANNHAIDLDSVGREDDAEQLRSATVNQFAEILGFDHPDTQSARRGNRIDCDIEPPPV